MKKIITLLIMLLVCAYVFTNTVYSESNKSTERASSVLRSIETYKAPAYPKQERKETYDHRKESGIFIPPTLTDALVVDLWQRMTKDLNIQGITIYRVSEDHVIQAMNIYLHRDWRNIAGYRPWTHWNFIRSLTKDERNQLAKEIVKYMYNNGVKEGD